MDFTFLTDGINFILQKINDLVTYIGNLGKASFVALWSLIQDVVCWLIDQLAAILSLLLAALPVSTVQSWASYWGEVPTQTLQIAQAVGVVPALGIIGVAIGIRLVLQLIPFVRLGS